MIARGRIQRKTPKAQTLGANPKFDDHPVRVGFFHMPEGRPEKTGDQSRSNGCAVSLIPLVFRRKPETRAVTSHPGPRIKSGAKGKLA